MTRQLREEVEAIAEAAEARFIAHTSDGRGRPMWVTEYPGEGGKDWGYGSEKNAKRMTPYWKRRFEKFCRDVGRKCSVIDVGPKKVSEDRKRSVDYVRVLLSKMSEATRAIQDRETDREHARKVVSAIRRASELISPYAD